MHEPRTAPRPLADRSARLLGRLRGRLLLAALVLTGLWAGAASYLVIFHDDALARFVARQKAMQVAYEARIEALQGHLDRNAAEQARSRETAQARLATLAERQAVLEQRQAALSTLAAGAAGHPGPPPSEPAAGLDAPEPLGLRGGDVGPAPGRRSERETDIRIARLEGAVARLADAQARDLAGLSAQAGQTNRRLHALLARTGLDPARFEAAPEGIGGPLVPLSADAFTAALLGAQRSRDEGDRLRRAAAALPLRVPLQGAFATSSEFGVRLDPFTRGPALHTGLDLKTGYGEPARATAPGRVTAAEPAGGYGNMVEVDHGHGIATRYAHLASIAVRPGQWVEAGVLVGRVGSTGRSTGSHLHYETRVDGEPVDPQRFLAAGREPD
ncbi:peptidoglycan DD-metalloendopeptidase family protein [Methylobacterium sp. A54F]